MQETSQQKEVVKQTKQETWSAWELAWQLGFQIAIPLIAFTLLGRFADKHFGTSPWLLLVGVVFAASSSSYLVYRKVEKILK